MKTNVAVFFGGKSTEHEISVISAVQAMLSMDENKYEVIPVYITKDNRFFTSDSMKDIDSFKNIPYLLSLSNSVRFLNDGTNTYLHRKNGIFTKKIRIDIAFPIVHGTNTEDGSLAGYLKTLNLPFVGCDVLSSAVGMDKYVMKIMLKNAGIPVLEGLRFRSNQNLMDIIAKSEAILKYPVIVKPVNLGSSIGINKAANKGELEMALDTAFAYSSTVLIEPCVEKLREINVSVLGDIDDATASVCEEPFSKDEILSFEDKYLNDGGEKGMAGLKRRIPADISEDLRKNIQETAVKAFKELECNGVVRIDFILEGEKFYLNEINTIPGSLSFYLWEPTGLKYPELLDKLIELALKRERSQNNLTYTFETNVLSSGLGLKGGKK